MREHYFGGREHAAIKHHFLKQYLATLSFKTLQAQRATPSFAYIDGFTGPWGAKDDEKYEDTSFGVALSVLKQVKSQLPSVRIRCVFCETRRGSFQDLDAYVKANTGDIESKCFHGRFEDHVEEITKFVGSEGFLFAFLDPKGWKVDAAAITPLLKGRWSEVLFNFMSEFAGRFLDYSKVEESYAALLDDVDWRKRFEEIPVELPNDEKVLLLFRRVLKDRWNFSYVLELPVKKPNRDRIFYKLMYGTRSPHGVLAFRDAQAKAEKEGTVVAIESEQRYEAQLFPPEEQADFIVRSAGVGSQMHCARIGNAIDVQLSKVRDISFLRLAAEVLEDIPAREKDVKSAIRVMMAKGLVDISNADGSRKSIRNSTLVSRRASS